MTGELMLTPGQVARALGKDVSAISRAIDAGELPAVQNPATKRWQIALRDFMVYEKAITAGRVPVRLPDPQQPTIGAVRSVVEPMMERILAELVVMNRRLAAFEALLGPASPASVDQLPRTEDQAASISRSRANEILSRASAQVAETKRRAGVTQ